MAKGSREWMRIVIWSFWTLNTVIDFVYMVMTFATNAKLIKTYLDLDISIHNTAWRAPLAATVMGGLFVLLFNILSCVILIRKSINRSGPGFGYGFILAWCFVMSFMCLLCALVTSGFSEVVKTELETKTKWTKLDTGAYMGTTVFAFICSIMFMLFFVCLVVFQGGIMKTTGLYDPTQDEKRKRELALAQGALAMGAAGTQI